MMRNRFHPSDKSARAMFYRAHNQIAEGKLTFFAIQNGPNPLPLRRSGALPRSTPTVGVPSSASPMLWISKCGWPEP
jgi:hypothetical protein